MYVSSWKKSGPAINHLDCTSYLKLFAWSEKENSFDANYLRSKYRHADGDMYHKISKNIYAPGKTQMKNVFANEKKMLCREETGYMS